jgi:type II secretory pathway component PulF
MIFEYKAINKDGAIIKGEKESSDTMAASRTLKEEGLIVISIEPKKKKVASFSISFSAFKTVEKITFARNIGSMLDAGLALSRTLDVISRQTRNTKTKRIIDDMNQKIKAGTSFSTALESYPKVFNSLFVSMTKAGEESGNLAESFKNISNQLEKNYLLMKKIKGAMVYPGVIVAAMSIVGFFMLTNIVPTLSKTFKELNVELPQTTKIIIALSDFLQNQTIAFLGVGIAIITAIILFFKSVVGKKLLDKTLVHAPLFGELTKQINSAKTARTLSSLLKAGVPYLQAIQITKGVVSNHIYKNILTLAEKKVETGDKISGVFNENEKFYPSFVGEMIAVGEETGELSEMLLKVAEFYENEVDQKTKNMSTIVEPLLMLIVGVAVGFFAISMISPMYSLVENI